MKKILGLILMGLFIVIGCDNQKSAEQAAGKPKMPVDRMAIEKKALALAENWLGLVDAEEFAQSWEQASIMFKRAVPKEQWVNTLQNSRSGFGKVIDREVKSVKYTKTLPGAPDGEYVVILFNTSFQNKEQAVETITPMRDSDGQWRVSGYFIK